MVGAKIVFATKRDEKVSCPICKDMGFDRPGHICPCVSGEKPKDIDGDLPDFLKDLFGVRK